MIAETLALFSDADAPPVDPSHFRALPSKLAERDQTDRARYLRAKARGARWTCPDACTEARGDTCECPCGRRCHGRRYCAGH